MRAATAALALLLGGALAGCGGSGSEEAAASRIGWLKLQSRPGVAEVWIDGRRIGATPDDFGSWLALEVESGWVDLFAADDGGRFAAMELYVAGETEHARMLELEPITARGRARLEELLTDGCVSMDMEACRHLEAWSERLALDRADWSEIDRAARSGCTDREPAGCLLAATLRRRHLLGPASLAEIVAAFEAVCEAGEPHGCLFAEGFERDGWQARFVGRGNRGWRRTSDCGVGAGACLRSGEISHGEVSSVRLELEFDVPGEISFWYRAEREACCDRLELWVDGARVARLEAIDTAAAFRHLVAAGAHAFEWRYVKDDAVSEGADAAWIDEIVATGVHGR